jgi:hypothetical protein
VIEIEHFQQALAEQLIQMNGLTDKAQTAGHVMAHKISNANLTLKSKTISSSTKALNVLKQLDHCAQSISALSPSRQILARYILQMRTQLHWYQKAVENNPAFMQGHANAQLIGPNGLYVNEEIIVGVSLVAPHLTYPDHNHPPEEVYIVLSEGQWWQQGEQWMSPGVKGYVYNPENIMHAMSSTEKPLLAIWCLNLE